MKGTWKQRQDNARTHQDILARIAHSLHVETVLSLATTVKLAQVDINLFAFLVCRLLYADKHTINASATISESSHAAILEIFCNSSLCVVTGRILHLQTFTVIDRIDDCPHSIIDSCLGNTMHKIYVMHRASRKVSKGNCKSYLVWDKSNGTILKVIIGAGHIGC
jgi:hypothetical protein